MTERPRGAKEFLRLLQRHAGDIDQAPQRVMHLVRVGVVCAFLDEIRTEEGGHLFIVKGGTAMQLRLGIRARATTDLDVLFAGYLDDWLARFDDATMDRAWNGFTITRKSVPTQIEISAAGYRPWRVPLQLRYEGREFGSVSLEVAVDPGADRHHDLVEPDATALAVFAIDPPRLIPVLDVAHQIAQKVHACTEPIPGGNTRVRDLIDIWLLEALLDTDELPAVRAACVDTFRRRQAHPWPPTVNPAPNWARDYELLVTDHPDAPADLDAACTHLTNLLNRIDRTES